MSILTRKDAEYLIASGLLSPTSNDDTQMIHKRRLNRWSDEEYSDLPLDAFSSATSSTQFYNIPKDLISLATLRHLGFNNETAAYIWGQWEKKRGTITLIDFATNHVKNKRVKDAFEDRDQDWHDFMNDCGISVEVQKHIMDPVFQDIRMSESCLFWVTDTMELRYRGLEEVKKTSYWRAATLAAQRSRRKGAKYAKNEALTNATSNSMLWNATTSKDKDNLNFVTIYKGIDRGRAEGLLNDVTGEVINIHPLISNSLTGFKSNIQGSALYFTAQHDVAVSYACYIKHRDNISGIIIVNIKMPLYAIRLLPKQRLQEIYWPSSQWKTLVYNLRRNKGLPSEVGKSLSSALLIMATISTKPNQAYRKLTSPEQVTKECCLKDEKGEPAIQYVFRGEKGVDFIDRHTVGGKTAHGLTNSEYVQWCQDRRYESEEEHLSDESLVDLGDEMNRM
ncbi:uncharacterized protein GGS22DRAFT_195545 [Annulohypoxylon maeteangense]|uniref:uncharacterized protein n=1 Tax=Annulohypoxylon maeteangense TaxID=1927788 RepID=UPI002007EF04|nr:uncharacterized protein GGS22DRAFT_195545 [Annulohypoxylon maeteangense]KAI0882819.1 hypothetical protein GGS22DRAFT_195545 [Annulohypoxylon maeteangense]